MRLHRAAFLVTLFGTALAASCSSSPSSTRPESPGTGTSGGDGHSGGSDGTGGSNAGGSGATGTGGGLGFAGGGTGPVDNSCGAVEQEAESKLQPADIIWAIDNSGSMAETAMAVQDNMNTFTNRLASSGVDVHLILISTTNGGNDFGGGGGGGGGVCFPGFYCPGGADAGGGFQDMCQGSNGVCIGAPFGSGNCPDDTKLPNFLHLLQCVNSWNAFNKIVQYYPDYKDSLRMGASKHVVVVTDDDSVQGNYTADQFQMAFQQLDPAMFASYKVDGIVNMTNCPSRQSTVAMELIKRTQGASADICLLTGNGSAAFQPIFDDLANAVLQGSQLTCEWTIPPPPNGQTFDASKVNVHFKSSAGQTVEILKAADAASCGPDGGWVYDNDAAPTKVIACKATCDKLQADPGGHVSVAFGCKTNIIPPH